jgi:hypothetical protein
LAVFLGSASLLSVSGGLFSRGLPSFYRKQRAACLAPARLTKSIMMSFFILLFIASSHVAQASTNLSVVWFDWVPCHALQTIAKTWPGMRLSLSSPFLQAAPDV